MDAIAAAGFPQGHKQFDRLLDLAVLLRRYRPRHIVEMGSGLSTVVFARYAAKTGASLASFEESPDWIAITRRALAAAGCSGPAPVLARRVEEGDTCYFDRPVPVTCDFLYIDAPSAALADGAPAACVDTLRAWEGGAFPKTVVIDSRHHSVARLLASPHAQRYRWAFEWRLRREPRRLGRHTVAILQR
jgi:hypothetical protein